MPGWGGDLRQGNPCADDTHPVGFEVLLNDRLASHSDSEIHFAKAVVVQSDAAIVSSGRVAVPAFDGQCFVVSSAPTIDQHFDHDGLPFV
ncbi:MAG: hypothetical protein ACK5WY_07635 [Holosporaceae bacterium]